MQSWATEAEDRLAAFDAGQMKAILAEVVFEELENLRPYDSSKSHVLSFGMPPGFTRPSDEDLGWRIDFDRSEIVLAAYPDWTITEHRSFKSFR